MLLLAAFFCALVTVGVKVGLFAFQSRPVVEAAQRNQIQTDEAKPRPSEPVATVEVAKRDLPKTLPKSQPAAPPKSQPAPQEKKNPRAISVDELQALNAQKPKVAGLADAPLPGLAPGSNDLVVPGRNPIGAADPNVGRANRPLPLPVPRRKDPIAAARNRARINQKGLEPRHRLQLGALGPFANRPVIDGQSPEDDDNAKYALDPTTGAWLSADKRWHVRHRYYLPIDGPDIDAARRIVMADAVIELEWWFPRRVDIHEQHHKGKVTKLRYLAAVHQTQLPRIENEAHVISTLGTNPSGFLLVEAETLFYLHVSHVGHNRRMEAWRPVPSDVEEKPSWFPDDKMTIKRGQTGRLPVQGAEIEVVRKAVRDLEEGAEIREAKWWPPRVNRADGHRMSKLRYEAIHNDNIDLGEFVFDYKLGGAGYPRSADELFPEDDRRATSLAATPKDALKDSLPLDDSGLGERR